MKSKMVLGILVLAVTAFSVQAQPQGGGFRGGFGGNVGETVADILVLNNDAATKVIEKMNVVQEELRAEMQESFQGGGGGGDMRERMQEIRKKQTEKYAATLKTLLSEDEVKTVEPFLGGFGRRTYAPVRALRQIDLKDDQRAEFRKISVALYEKINEIRPAFGGGQGGGQGVNREEIQAKTDEAVAEFSKGVTAKLSDDQKSAWETKTAEVQKELDEQREQRGARGGQGGNN
jgi:hypothetical protein